MLNNIPTLGCNLMISSFILLCISMVIEAIVLIINKMFNVTNEKVEKSMLIWLTTISIGFVVGLFMFILG